MRTLIYTTREIHRKIKKKIEKKFKFPFYVQGGVPARSSISNAKKHVNKYVVMNIDIKDFFPSVTEKMVFDGLVCRGAEHNTALYIAKICSFRNGLPQGSPLSCLLANFALWKIDIDILRICRKKQLVYTRYIDDISISADKDIRSLKGVFFNIIKGNGFEISEKKYSCKKNGTKQIVTGIVVNHKLSPDKKYTRLLKNEIRSCWIKDNIEIIAASYGFTKKQLKNNFFGRINFVEQINKKIAREIRGLLTKINQNDWED